MRGTLVHELHLRVEADVFAGRQVARALAEALGLDAQDQVRVATALSEVGRETLAVGGGLAEFVLPPDGSLTARIHLRAPLGDAAALPGLAAAGRLLDAARLLVVDGHPVVELVKNVPHTGRDRSRDVEDIRARLARLAPHSPMEELRAQNSELLATLDALEARQQELLQLNQELEETNRGVMAMYGQLSDELEETNRGVVALYAELDDRGQQLQRVNEAKTRFLRNVSHELRTPVNSVLGLTRLLLDPDGGVDSLGEEQRHQIELLNRCGLDLLSLVNELLDLAKAESGTLEPVRAPVDLAALLAGIGDTVRPLVDPAAVRLRVDTPRLALSTDGSLLRRILQNLVSNAARFTERGEIVLTVEEGEQGLALAVRDTGVGIPPEEHARIFEEFYQVRGPHQGRGAGTGLGLPYARRLAELLGGELTVASAPGEGSTFTLTLPADVLTLPSTLTPVGCGGAECDGQGPPHVRLALLVDDEPVFRTVFRSMMVAFADEIAEADDAASALAWLRRHTPSVIFLDLRLPGMDGASLLTRLGEDATLRQVPVVIVTAVDLDTPDRERLGPAAATLAKSALTPQILRDVLCQLGLRDA